MAAPPGRERDGGDAVIDLTGDSSGDELDVVIAEETETAADVGEPPVGSGGGNAWLAELARARESRQGCDNYSAAGTRRQCCHGRGSSPCCDRRASRASGWFRQR